MRLLLSEAIPEDDRKKIEEAIREPADKAVQMIGLATSELRDPAESKSIYGWVFDTTVGAPKFSDGAAWIALPALSGGNSWGGTQTFSGLISATGGQIKFPATQVPSADANTLDDYEEGTWTPAITFGGASVGITYSTQNALYTKIGRMVFITIRIVMTSKGSSTGTAGISGLPFTSNASTDSQVAKFTATNMSSLVDPTANIGPSSSAIVFADNNTGTRSNLTNSNFANNTDIEFGMFYSV